MISVKISVQLLLLLLSWLQSHSQKTIFYACTYTESDPNQRKKNHTDTHSQSNLESLPSTSRFQIHWILEFLFFVVEWKLEIKTKTTAKIISLFDVVSIVYMMSRCSVPFKRFSLLWQHTFLRLCIVYMFNWSFFLLSLSLYTLHLPKAHEHTMNRKDSLHWMSRSIVSTTTRKLSIVRKIFNDFHSQFKFFILFKM